MAHVDDNPPVSRATNAPLVSPYSLWDSPARRSPAEAGRAQLARTQVRHRRRALAVDHDERLRPGEARLGPVVRAAVAAQDALDPRPDLAGRGWLPARHSRRIPRGGGGLRQVLRGAVGRGGFGPIWQETRTGAAFSRCCEERRRSAPALPATIRRSGGCRLEEGRSAS